MINKEMDKMNRDPIIICSLIFLLFLMVSSLSFVKADTTFQEEYNYFFITNSSAPTIPPTGGNGGGPIVTPLSCSAMGGTCTTSVCSPDTHQINYNCASINGLNTICCSPSLCTLTRQFIGKNTMYSYSPQNFSNWYKQLLNLSFALSPTQATEYISNYSSKCGKSYCFIIEILPSPLNKYLEKLGLLVYSQDACQGATWFLWILLIIIFIIIVVYVQKRKELKKKGKEIKAKVEKTKKEVKSAFKKKPEKPFNYQY